MKYLIFVFVSLLFLGCNNSSNKTIGNIKAPEVCTIESEKQFVYDVMHDTYLWADETAILDEQNITAHEDDKAILKTLKHANDRFSFIMDKKAHDDYFEAGVNKGFGYFPSLVRYNNELVINVNFIYPSSPASKIGLKRGDLIEEFDGFTFSQIDANTTLFNKYFGSNEENLTVEIKLTDQREFNISKEEFDIKTVLHRSVINQDGRKVGYLVFQSFIGTAINEIDESFTYFKSQGIDELVLDIRYNGGGYIYVANHLSSLIGGNRVSGTIFNQTQFNKKYSKYNDIDYFEESQTNALNLSRVFIITTDDSCSASELVINGLKSTTNSVEVIQVGDTTCGKPYGMISLEYCEKYILPVQMQSVNGNGNGGYINGITPNCSSDDDISIDFGETDEDSLASALYYISNNQCKVKFSKSARSVKQESLFSGFRKMYGLF